MKLTFYKYQSTGNDFIILNNWDKKISHDSNLAKKLCHRKFGIGADGLIILEKHHSIDFNMVFYNPDGSMSFCGNGSRAAISFFHHYINKGVKSEFEFLSTDGIHHGKVLDNEKISVAMHLYGSMQCINNHCEINTGSPHYIIPVQDVDSFPLIEEARLIRYGKSYKEEGINVNAVEFISPSELKMRTYERGVEDETLSCGTGVTAAALTLTRHFDLNDGNYSIKVMTQGGELNVSYDIIKGEAYNIWLSGASKEVFVGTIETNDL